MPKLKTLKVYPNPFSHIDHEGRPAGVVAMEPIGDGVTVFDDRRFVGATLKAKITKKAPLGSAQQNEQDTFFVFADEPSVVHMTPYYVRAIKNGLLIPADEDSARKANVKFADPAQTLYAAREGAAAHLKLMAHEEHDSDFCDTLLKFVFGPMLKSPESEKPKLEDRPKTKSDDKSKGGV